MKASRPKAALALAAVALLAACQVTTAPPPGPRVQAAPAAVQLGTARTAVNAFLSACVGTAQTPSRAAAVLTQLGFTEAGRYRNRVRYTAPFATATLSLGGQCTVTPIDGQFPAVVALLNRRMPGVAPSARKLNNEEAWLLPNGAVVLVSRKGGAMTRTVPGVYRG